MTDSSKPIDEIYEIVGDPPAMAVTVKKLVVFKESISAPCFALAAWPFRPYLLSLRASVIFSIALWMKS